LPEIHAGGVRGHLVRFRKNRNEEWEKISELDFRSLKLYEGVYIELGTQQLHKLLDEVSKRKVIVKEGVEFGHREYVLNEKENVLVIDNGNVKKILHQLLEKGFSEEFWGLLNNANPKLADKLSAGHLQLQRKEVVDSLKARLKEKYHETKGDDSWQSWIYRHSWLFGDARKCLSRAKIFSTKCRYLYKFQSIPSFPVFESIFFGITGIDDFARISLRSSSLS
jgi:hypothetical protein